MTDFQDLFLGLRQIVRLPEALLFQEMPVPSQRGVIDQALRCRVGNLDPLQVKKDQMLVDGGALFARLGEQGSVTGFVGLGGVDQAGENSRPVHLFRKTFEFLEGCK